MPTFNYNHMVHKIIPELLRAAPSPGRRLLKELVLDVLRADPSHHRRAIEESQDWGFGYPLDSLLEELRDCYMVEIQGGNLDLTQAVRELEEPTQPLLGRLSLHLLRLYGEHPSRFARRPLPAARGRGTGARLGAGGVQRGFEQLGLGLGGGHAGQGAHFRIQSLPTSRRHRWRAIVRGRAPRAPSRARWRGRGQFATTTNARTTRPLALPIRTRHRIGEHIRATGAWPHPSEPPIPLSPDQFLDGKHGQYYTLVQCWRQCELSVICRCRRSEHLAAGGSILSSQMAPNTSPARRVSRIFRGGVRPPEDDLVPGSTAERLQMMWPLTLDAWAFRGRAD